MVRIFENSRLAKLVIMVWPFGKWKRPGLQRNLPGGGAILVQARPADERLRVLRVLSTLLAQGAVNMGVVRCKRNIAHVF